MKGDVTTRAERVPQVIRADESYTVAEFRRRTGIGDYAFRELRQAGLRIISVGKKRFVRGCDWLAHLEKIVALSDTPPK
jgi:hypothetical protein